MTFGFSMRPVGSMISKSGKIAVTVSNIGFNSSDAEPIIRMKLSSGKEVNLNFGKTCESYKNAIDFLSYVGSTRYGGGSETVLLPPTVASELASESNAWVGAKDICNVKIRNVGGVISTCSRQAPNVSEEANSSSAR